MVCPYLYQEGRVPPAYHAASAGIRRARLEQAPPDCGANGRIAVGSGPSSQSSWNVIFREEVAAPCAPTVSTSLGVTARPAFADAGSPSQSTRSPAVGSKGPPGSWARRTGISMSLFNENVLLTVK